MGVILTALDGRFKVVVLLDGGFFEGNPLPGMDGADFAPRLKAPVLMIGGKYDLVFLARMRCFGCSEHQQPTKRLSISIPHMYRSSGLTWCERWSPGSTNIWAGSTELHALKTYFCFFVSAR